MCWIVQVLWLKSVDDLVNLLTVLVDSSHPSVPEGGYSTAMTGTFDGLHLGVLDPKVFYFSPDVIKPDTGATKQRVWSSS